MASSKKWPECKYDDDKVRFKSNDKVIFVNFPGCVGRVLKMEEFPQPRTRIDKDPRMMRKFFVCCYYEDGTPVEMWIRQKYLTKISLTQFKNFFISRLLTVPKKPKQA